MYARGSLRLGERVFESATDMRSSVAVNFDVFKQEIDLKRETKSDITWYASCTLLHWLVTSNTTTIELERLCELLSWLNSLEQHFETFGELYLSLPTVQNKSMGVILKDWNVFRNVFYYQMITSTVKRYGPVRLTNQTISRHLPIAALRGLIYCDRWLSALCKQIVCQNRK